MISLTAIAENCWAYYKNFRTDSLHLKAYCSTPRRVHISRCNKINERREKLLLVAVQIVLERQHFGLLGIPMLQFVK